jgi:hypothetical protein
MQHQKSPSGVHQPWHVVLQDSTCLATPDHNSSSLPTTHAHALHPSLHKQRRMYQHTTLMAAGWDPFQAWHHLAQHTTHRGQTTVNKLFSPLRSLSNDTPWDKW